MLLQFNITNETVERVRHTRLGRFIFPRPGWRPSTVGEKRKPSENVRAHRHQSQK